MEFAFDKKHENGRKKWGRDVRLLRDTDMELENWLARSLFSSLLFIY
jgi:hypothetical protein